MSTDPRIAPDATMSNHGHKHALRELLGIGAQFHLVSVDAPITERVEPQHFGTKTVSKSDVHGIWGEGWCESTRRTEQTHLSIKCDDEAITCEVLDDGRFLIKRGEIALEYALGADPSELRV